MAPIRGRGGFRSRGTARGSTRGAFRGSRGRGRGRPRGAFRTSRIADPDTEEANNASQVESEAESQIATADEESSEEEEGSAKTGYSYNTLLQSLTQSSEQDERQRKRRKLDHNISHVEEQEAVLLRDAEEEIAEALAAPPGADEIAASSQDEEPESSDDREDDEDETADLYLTHFGSLEVESTAKRVQAVEQHRWQSQRQVLGDIGRLVVNVPDGDSGAALKPPVKMLRHLSLKQRLAEVALGRTSSLDRLQQVLAPYMFGYQDILFGDRTTQNGSGLRDLACLHALNHVYKGRDRVLKNNTRLAKAEDDEDIELRDQGFTRPKVLFLLGTRHACAQTVDSLMSLCEPEQQENKKRFLDEFVDTETKFSDDRPDDFRELFEGNADDDFRLGLKFTRKTVKYFARFYASDMVIASPLGLRRIIEHTDPKKADSDFLSSIELVVVDQADAMLMQLWDHVDFVLQHLNLQPKDAHGCDFSRVRHWYLDGQAKFMRQTIVLSAFVTPELNKLYNASMLNIAGKVKYTPTYEGAITSIGLPVKQTFSRFDATSPAAEPDARFKYFNTAILPTIVRTPKPAEGGQGILIFVPSYYDFVRLRNHFANSTATQNLSFGSISEYTSRSDVRRARSHFFTGRHAVLLYSGRAHHFNRFRIRGVRKAFLYGLPDNPKFYEELVEMMGMSIQEGKVGSEEASVRSLFSKFDGLKLERVVGSERVGAMMKGGVGDTFDFV
ncbi:rRNA-binding ribosome biosynthesis protein utp25 [Elasticomyces elasticus]|nr:rRNA-binding ribosome biosynthesis protein utp25 [Elasticomyces elasticus]